MDNLEKKIYSLICCNICKKEIKNKIIVECEYHYCDNCIRKVHNPVKSTTGFQLKR